MIFANTLVPREAPQYLMNGIHYIIYCITYRRTPTRPRSWMMPRI